MASTAKRFSLKAPLPKVVLVPDAYFFVRVVPIAEAASAADVTSQVELALEGLSPFPLAQIYYGYHWAPGARHAVIYAAYRKRFAEEQTDAWTDADVVMPVFAAILTAKVEPATTVVLRTEEGVTAMHWDGSAEVPTAIALRSWPADTPAAEKLRLHDEVVRGLGGTRNIIELDSPPVAQTTVGSDYEFHAGALAATFTRQQVDNLDVRDKDELVARRNARMRDLFLWRAFLTCAVGIAVALLLELGLVGGRVWQRSRQVIVDKQAPVVADILRQQTLATRIEELSTNRLRPFEMIAFLQSKKPPAVTFSRTTTSGIHTIEIEAYTMQPTALGAYEDALRQLPELAKVEIVNPQMRENTQTFRLVVTFKPGAFKS